MRIDWIIEKKRGNLRPVLQYTVSLDDHEKELALPPVIITSCIPRPQEHWQEYCYPDHFERSGESSATPDFHALEIPSHKGHSWVQHLRLPWRQDNTYPEVEESFKLLRNAFENELARAYASLPVKIENSLTTTSAAKASIAPGILAERFLRLAEKTAQQASAQ